MYVYVHVYAKLFPSKYFHVWWKKNIWKQEDEGEKK